MNCPDFSLESRQLLSTDVLTYHNDNFRTGQNLNETTLTPTNVNGESFGKVGQVSVDGYVYTQPLYRSNVEVPGLGTHNLVFVATEHDSVYAFDSDTLTQVWKTSFINPSRGINTVSPAVQHSDDIVPEIGITGTPVIDPSTNTLYVAAKTSERARGVTNYVWRLHALDIATGNARPGSGLKITASVKGRGDGSQNGVLPFNSLRQGQRPGLLLLNGVVYVTFASYQDVRPYHGWVLGYNARTLRRVKVLNTTPNGINGGIWMSGAAPAADSRGNIFLSTGNGTFSKNWKLFNYGSSVLRIASNGKNLNVSDSFTPYNYAYLNQMDFDFGSAGILIIPDPATGNPLRIFTGGKFPKLFVLDPYNLGKYTPNSDRVLQTFTDGMKPLFGTPAYFNGKVYLVGTPGKAFNSVKNTLMVFDVVNGQFSGPTATGSVSYGYPGSTPSISANGNQNGIVWTLDNGAYASSGPAILTAYDAANSSKPIYQSSSAGSRDTSGPAVKFQVPTIADGRVYVGGQGTLTVYGLLTPPAK